MQGTTLLLWGLLFGAIGIGFLTYARKQKAVVPLISGIALLVLPYFFSNVYLLVLSGTVLVALPYFIRL